MTRRGSSAFPPCDSLLTPFAARCFASVADFGSFVSPFAARVRFTVAAAMLVLALAFSDQALCGITHPLMPPLHDACSSLI